MRLPKPILSFTVLASLYLVIFILGCHKRTSVAPDPVPTTTSTKTVDDSPTITQRGCSYVGNYSYFAFSGKGLPSSVNTVLWDYGDGEKRSEFITRHVYSMPGTYTVKLLLNGTVSIENKFIVEQYLPGSVYTAGMAGMRRWHGFASGVNSEFNSYTSGRDIDTDLTVEIFNGGIIRLPFFKHEVFYENYGIMLNLISEDTLNKVLSFKECTHETISIKYYYAFDSIVYTNNWTSGKRYEYFIIHSP